MIVVIGRILARDGKADPLLALSLEHVKHSRMEPGCISHAISRDVENPQLLVFVEEWADQPALAAHFALKSSRDFVRSALQFAAGPPTITIYEARALPAQLTGQPTTS